MVRIQNKDYLELTYIYICSGLQNECLKEPSQDGISGKVYLVLTETYTCMGLLNTIPKYQEHIVMDTCTQCKH